ncbi:RTC4-like domain-containing protein, partial [Halteromyces radiatus]|uniref:RTC4-like domain-containing protein n=1 Tax=Halteromyces radiatus TaxID=101107 RepID=UPI00221E6F4E
RRPVANMDQYSFCLLHTIELVIKPQGDENDWPTVIPFCTLKDRILGFQDELDNVIDNKLDSSYRQAALEAYKKMGTNQARSTMGVMTRLETILPGYYGTKGASVIQEHLVEMYLHSGKLTSKVTSPQLPLEYLQHVLVPEVGFRLIREDLINKNSSKQYEPDLDDQAKQIMAESSNFGSYLQPLGWDDGTLLDENDDIDDSNDDHTSDNDDDDDCYIIH